MSGQRIILQGIRASLLASALALGGIGIAEAASGGCGYSKRDRDGGKHESAEADRDGHHKAMTSRPTHASRRHHGADQGAPEAGESMAATGQRDIVGTAVAAGQFNTLATALKAADLVGALQGEGPFTVFAPTDEAFAKLPKGTVEELLKPGNRERLTAILTYHVVPGRIDAAHVMRRYSANSLQGQPIDFSARDGKVFADKAQVIGADVNASNGIIHVIDRVILPADKNLVEVAQGAGTFNTLIAAAEAAGLAETLAGEGPYTIFAPTDEAFAKLPAGTVENLLKPENREQLRSILLYHVASGRFNAGQVGSMERIPAMNGRDLRIESGEEGIMVAGARVIAPNNRATNGIAHAIDAVMMPPAETAMATVHESNRRRDASR